MILALLTLMRAHGAEGVLTLADAEAAPPGWVEVLVRADRDALRIHVGRTRGRLSKAPYVCDSPCALALRPMSHEIWLTGRGRTPGVTVLHPIVDGRYVVVGKTRSKVANWIGRGLTAAGVGLVAGGWMVGLRSDSPTVLDGGPVGRALLLSGAAGIAVGVPLTLGSRSRLVVEQG